jgi:hypothetical protein
MKNLYTLVYTTSKEFARSLYHESITLAIVNPPFPYHIVSASTSPGVSLSLEPLRNSSLSPRKNYSCTPQTRFVSQNLGGKLISAIIPPEVLAETFLIKVYRNPMLFY